MSRLATSLIDKLVTVYERTDGKHGSRLVTGYVRAVATGAIDSHGAHGYLFLIEVAEGTTVSGWASDIAGGPGDMVHIALDWRFLISRTMHPWPYDGPDGARTDQASVNLVKP